MRPLLLVDGNNLLIRAVEATRNHRTVMANEAGTNTAALVVFANTVARYIRTEVPFRVTVLWDGGYAARTALYPAYKANRPQAADPYRSTSRALVRDWLRVCGIPQLQVDGVEADDLIASYWRTATSPVTILSNDKDMLQLVGSTPTGHPCDQIRISSSATPTDRWGADRVAAHYGCTPEQLPLFLALVGDGSDNIPGARGIGEKRAIQHLSDAGWNLDAVTYPAIVSQRADIDLFLKLVDLRNGTHYPVPTTSPFMPVRPGPGPEWQTLHAFLQQHGLRELTRRLTAGELW
ncbi:5'-3' exonuclease [Streptomyces sp. cg35]|uniref:5'-3' exonuclease n=1 Tax=Streptomyces sp. cg35 TaxID=3421650 RepID=UPI003D170D98